MGRLRKVGSRLARGVLATNGAFLLRGLRFGMGDALFRLALAYDALDPFTKQPLVSPSTLRRLLPRYCQGRGVEVGPGNQPLCDPANTLFVDKFASHRNRQLQVNILADAHAIPQPDNSFDFLLSSHCLEHCPDTLRTLLEWKRLVRPGGTLILILPHKDRTFDCDRPVTTLQHHLDDYQKQVGYEDLTHLEEFERCALRKMRHWWFDEPGARKSDGTFDYQWMIAQGHVHYHVWTQNEIVDLVRHIGCEILVVEANAEDRPDSFVVVARVCKRSDEEAMKGQAACGGKA
jgi:SAM-dependent methyltransferase